VGKAVNRVDAVMDDVDLPTTIKLSQNHLPDQIVLGLSNERADWQSRLWRRVDNTDVTNS